MAEPKQNINSGQVSQKDENAEINPNEEQLSEADKKVYEEIFQSLKKIDKKVKTAKSKLHDKESTKKEQKSISFKDIAEKLIQSKQNSDIVNKEDLLVDINQSFQRVVIDIYSENQRLKKKQAEIEKIIKDQNHKLFQQHTKQQKYIQEIERLRFQLAQLKDENLMANRQLTKGQGQADNKKQPNKRVNKQQNNQSNEDYDFWNTPQNQNYSKKKKQFIQNSGLWVNQKSVGQNMFITEGRR